MSWNVENLFDVGAEDGPDTQAELNAKIDEAIKRSMVTLDENQERIQAAIRDAQARGLDEKKLAQELRLRAHASQQQAAEARRSAERALAEGQRARRLKLRREPGAETTPEPEEAPLPPRAPRAPRAARVPGMPRTEQIPALPPVEPTPAPRGGMRTRVPGNPGASADEAKLRARIEQLEAEIQELRAALESTRARQAPEPTPSRSRAKRSMR